MDLVLVNRPDTPLDLQGSSVAWCGEDVRVDPRFAVPFPRDPRGAWFDGAVVPCFGIWNGLDPTRRARLAAQVRVLRYRDAGDCVVELLPEPGTARLAIARVDGATTLSEAGARVARALRHGQGVLGRLLGRERLRPTDGLRIPVVEASGRSADRTLSIRLGVDGPLDPVPAAVTEGRADVYEQNLVYGGPFVVWSGDRRSLAPTAIAWIARP
ncbi:MAG: hypothetical protein JXB39_16940 [Deltaproteobacteria bacterium]|nr:hypothetical protein [Deltaproteobacteria bacterium]